MTPASAARLASSGPQNASASTVTLMKCLFAANAFSACVTAAGGCPVTSTMMSIAGWLITASALSVRWVPPLLAASSRLRAAKRSGAQPVRVSASFARGTERSASPTRWMPGVRRACERYIVPNLPAPMMPTRKGWPAACRSSSLRCKFIEGSLGGAGAAIAGVLDQAIIRQHFDRREVAIGDPGRTLEAADRVVAAVERQIDDPARPGCQVRARRVHEIAVEEQHRARRALGCDDPAFGDEPGDRLVVDRPQRIAGRGQVVPRFEAAALVALRNEHQRAVELVGLGEEQRDVHRLALGHLVVLMPGPVVLVPLPHG